jgi:hypothetical protein
MAFADVTSKHANAALRAVIAVACLALGAAAVAAQPLRTTYADARRAFEAQPVESRMRLQIFLTAAGRLTAAASERFNARVFAAIQTFQWSQGLAPDGILGPSAVAQLAAEAKPVLDSWDLQQRFHLFTMRKLWVPVGLLQVAEPISTGMAYKDPFGHVRMDHSFVEDADLSSSYRAALERARNEGGTLGFSVRRPNFYTMTWTSSGGGGAYVRYHRSGSGLYGFSLAWDETAGSKAHRVARLVSMSLTADLRGRPLDPVTVLAPLRTSNVVATPANGLRP